MLRSSLALRVITSSCAWRPEQHLGQAHGSVHPRSLQAPHVTCVELALDVQMNSASGVECS